MATTSVFLNDTTDSDELIDLVFLGVTPENDSLAPPILEGRGVEQDDEIIVSHNLKDEIDIKLGDTVKMATTNRAFEVVGFTEDSNYNTIPVAYVNRDMASQAMMIFSADEDDPDALTGPTPNMPIRVSGVVVTSDIDRDSLAENGLEYIDMGEFIRSIPGYLEQLLTFGLMIIALAIISSIIIGIFMYILTMQKKAIFGVLKIQGYRNAVVVKSVIYQTLILTIVGFAIGLAATLASVHFLEKSVPLAVSGEIYAIVTAFSILCSLIGALFSVRSILKIDPLDAI